MSNSAGSVLEYSTFVGPTFPCMRMEQEYGSPGLAGVTFQVKYTQSEPNLATRSQLSKSGKFGSSMITC